MKRNPTYSLLFLFVFLIPFIGYAQDYPIIPEKNHAAGLHLVGYSNEVNSVEAGYSYKLLKGRSLVIRAGFSGGLLYPRKKIADITRDDIHSFVAPNFSLEYGSSHIFYLSFWKNFMVNNLAPYRAAIGYKHFFANKNLAIVVNGNFLWIKKENKLEPSTLYTYGGIGIGLDRYF